MYLEKRSASIREGIAMMYNVRCIARYRMSIDFVTAVIGRANRI